MAVKVEGMAQFGALAHPLRQQILHATAECEMDAKEIAVALGVQPTRLYRHLDQLVEVGLLEVVGERHKRGLASRLFRAKSSATPSAEGSPSGYQRLASAQATLFINLEDLTGILRELVSDARFREVRNGTEVQLTVAIDMKKD